MRAIPVDIQKLHATVLKEKCSATKGQALWKLKKTKKN